MNIRLGGAGRGIDRPANWRYADVSYEDDARGFMMTPNDENTQEALVFIETSGNQAYLYATNKLKENIGASQLTYLAGADWATEAAFHWGGDPIIATSGKAIVRVPNQEVGKEIVRAVTKRALKEAPGLTIAGAVVSLDGDQGAAIAKAHECFNANRDAMGSTRFPMLPWSEPCATSGMPAAAEAQEGGNSFWYSAESIAKRKNAPKWMARIQAFFENKGKQEGSVNLSIAKDINELQAIVDSSQWLGVIYSDGNGLGQIFLDLEKHLETLRARGEADWKPFAAMKEFSKELEEATEGAFYAACRHIHDLGASVETKRTPRGAEITYRIPVIPLVLAGDDMTVMVQGEFALPFAEKFLLAFEEKTERSETISTIAKVALGAPRLSAGAGVALVKHHFPFHLAHALAEDLLKSSKLAKQKVRSVTNISPDKKPPPFPVSALDFHVLFDASYTDLKTIRDERMTCAEGDIVQRLYGGPYVVTPLEQLKGAEPSGREWARSHTFEELRLRMEALKDKEPDTDRLKLPSSQMHVLREAVAHGKRVADARLAELAWLDGKGLRCLKEDGGSLFFKRAKGDKEQVTRFVDALNGAAFWPDPANRGSGADAVAEDVNYD